MVIKARKRQTATSISKSVPKKMAKSAAEVTAVDKVCEYTPPSKPKVKLSKPAERSGSTSPPVIGKTVTGNELYEPSYTPPLVDEDATYCPTDVSTLHSEGDKPYDPEESEKDLQKLTELQSKLQQPKADGKSSSELNQQRLLLIELTKRVEEQRISLEKQMTGTNPAAVQPKSPESAAGKPNLLPKITDNIKLPANLAEILRNVKEKSKEVLAKNEASMVDQTDREQTVSSCAHYSPDDDYNGAISPVASRTPPHANDGASKPPTKKVKSNTPTKPVDPRLASKSDNKISRKDLRQKSSLKNMTESELVERARKQLEEMSKNTPSPSPVLPLVVVPQPPLPSLPPPPVYPPMYPPPVAMAPFPPPFGQLPPPPPPIMPPPTQWNPQLEAAHATYSGGSGGNYDHVSAAVMDYVNSDQPPTAWDQLPPVLQKKRRKFRRQHEHWRGLREQWRQHQQNYDAAKDTDHRPARNRDLDYRVGRNSPRDEDMRKPDRDMRRPIAEPPLQPTDAKNLELPKS